MHSFHPSEPLSRFFEPSPRPGGYVTAIDGGEARARLIADGALVPAVPAGAVTSSAAPDPCRLAIDQASFHFSACEILRAEGIKRGRELADSPDVDERLRNALRLILAQPTQTREQVLARSARKGRR
jgi:hypothetical protein